MKNAMNNAQARALEDAALDAEVARIEAMVDAERGTVDTGKNSNLHAARKNKFDEFYTRLEDIEDEISMHDDYVEQFYGKTVLCNCDDNWSNFRLFFNLHFDQLKLKKVIFTHLEANGNHPYKEEWCGDKDDDYNPINIIRTELKGNGDFRSAECIEALDECDIVVTNPPFSLFREFVNLVLDHGKDLVIIGNMNARAYKEIFPLLKDGKVSLGYTNPKIFIKPDKTTAKFGNICWYTTLNIRKHQEELVLVEHYDWDPKKYPKYDNYDAINVDKINDIPCDYYGVMGVPITIFDKFCPSQFEIIDINPHFFALVAQGHKKPKQLTIKGRGKDPYVRVLIRRRPENINN